MNTLLLAAAQPANGGNNYLMIGFIIIMGVFIYFGMIRPQKKQQQKRQQMMDKLKKGDQVVLIDGLHGKIDSIDNNNHTVVVDADGIYLTFSRMAVRQIIPAPAAAKPEETAAPASEPEKKSEAKKDVEAATDSVKADSEKPAEKKD